MIKEWCSYCSGRGELNSTVLVKNKADYTCPNCQGKGYTELEPLNVTKQTLERILIRHSSLDVIEHIEYILKVIEHTKVLALVEEKRNTNFDIKELKA